MKLSRYLPSVISAITVLTGLSFMANSSWASSVSCQELRAAYKNDLMNREDVDCTSTDTACLNLQEEIVRKTVKHFTNITDEELANLTRKELWKNYQPYTYRLILGEKTLEVANIDLGDNGFELLFNENSSVYSGVSTSDGDLEVDNVYCEDVAFEPYINEVRKTNLCEQIVPQVQAQILDTRFDMTVCVKGIASGNEFRNSSQFYITDFSRSEISLDISRNLQDVGGWYFSCTGKLDRLTNKASEVQCQAHN